MSDRLELGAFVDEPSQLDPFSPAAYANLVPASAPTQTSGAHNATDKNISLPAILLVGGLAVGAGLVLVLVVGLLLLNSSVGVRPATSISATDLGHPHPVVFNKAVENLTAAVKTDDFQFVPGEVFPNSTAEIDSQEIPAEVHSAPLWQLPADPSPKESDYELSNTLNIQLNGWQYTISNYNDMTSVTKEPAEFFPATSKFGNLRDPIFASQNGPFIIVRPYLQGAPYGWKLYSKKEEWVRYERIEGRMDDLPVIDLRTGDAVGRFSSKIPFWLFPVLSPDGKTLVGPSNEIPIDTHIVMNLTTSKEKKAIFDRQHQMYVWKRDSDAKPLPLPIEGEISSMTFANNRVLVVLLESPTRRIEAWDTLSGKRVRNIPLATALEFAQGRYRMLPNPSDIANFALNPPRAQNILAVSGGGKYVAAMSTAGVIVASLHDEKVLGTLPVTVSAGELEPIIDRNGSEVERSAISFSGRADQCAGLEFTGSGERLIASFQSMGGPQDLVIFDFNFCTGTVREKLYLPRFNWLGGYGEAQMKLTLCPGKNRYLLSLPEDISTLYDFQVRSSLNMHGAIRMPPRGPLLAYLTLGQNRNKTRCLVAMTPDQLNNANRSRVTISQIAPPLESPLEVDRSSLQPVRPVPPPEFQPLPKYQIPAFSPATSLRSKFWPSAWTSTKAFSVHSSGMLSAPTQIEVLDLSVPSGGLQSGPFEVFPAIPRPQSPLMNAPRVPLTAFYEPDNLVAVTDPELAGRVEIWSIETEQRKIVFESGQRPKREVISWTDFDIAGRLLTLEAGILSSWDIKSNEVQARYAVDGNYREPVQFSPDRKMIFLSRGSDFDILDTENGNCLTRLACTKTEVPTEACFCPDGVHLAVSYAAVRTPTDLRRIYRQADWDVHQQSYPQTNYRELIIGRATSVAVWDLSDGTMRHVNTATAPPTRSWEPTGITWASTEHLVLGTSTSAPYLYDFKLDSHTANLQQAINKSGDGRLWIANVSGSNLGRVTNARSAGLGQPPNFANDPMSGLTNNPLAGRKDSSWGLTTLFGNQTVTEKALFAEGRQIIDFRKQPVQLELDVGDVALAEKFAPRILSAMAAKGWVIGPSHFVFKVSGQTANTHKKITFTKPSRSVMIPKIVYKWQLVDSSGNKILQTETEGAFALRNSKYKTTESPSRGFPRDLDINFDFGRKDPKSAMVEEIRQSGAGLENFFSSPGVYLISPSTESLQIPVKLPVQASFSP
ncbi:MAG: WD40 repeat domain-containing protein [Pirellulaceae bacterium]